MSSVMSIDPVRVEAGAVNGRLFRPEMLMIGATGRNAGKTELACRIIRRHATAAPIAALKVTTVERADGTCPHGDESCGACSTLAESWCVTRELDADSHKDTSRLLASGAREAYWMRVTREALRDGAAGLLAHAPTGWASVCESNSLSRVVEPGLFLQVQAANERTIKPSALAVASLADRVVVSDGLDFDLSLDRISLLDGQWALQREACAVVVARAVPHAPVLESLRAQFTQVEIVCVPIDSDDDRGMLRAVALAVSRSAHETCLVVQGPTGAVPAGLVNAMFRRLDGVETVVARDPAGVPAGRFVLVRRSLLPGIAAALEGAPSAGRGLSALG